MKTVSIQRITINREVDMILVVEEEAAEAVEDKELEVEDKGDQSLETLLDRMARL